MKYIIVLSIVIYAFAPKSFGHNSDVDRAEAFQTCVSDCLEFEEPGFELKACLARCKQKYDLNSKTSEPLYCNSYEEGCEREGEESEI